MSFHDLSFDTSGLFQNTIAAEGLSPQLVEEMIPQAREIHQGIQDLKRLGQMPFLDLSSHAEALGEIQKKADEIREYFDHILVLGIGGSALGARWLVEALGKKPTPFLTFCDSISPFVWKKISEKIQQTKTFLVVVSKSGNTLETLAAFSYFQKILKEKEGGNFKKPYLFITDPHEGYLRKVATHENIPSLVIPSGVGGRYSILSPAGLFPAACSGVPLEDLLAGARRMEEKCRTDHLWENPPLLSATLHYLHDIKKKRRIRIHLSYEERLKGYGAWFDQLWAESLGKKFSLKGEELFCGTTAVSALGPQDQHSQLQLYLEGPKDKVVTLIRTAEEAEDVFLPQTIEPDSPVALLKGISVHRLLSLECEATEKTLQEAHRPTQKILLNRLDAHSIGQLIAYSELETVYSGGLYNINPFNQPAVESIKKNIAASLTKPTLI